MATRGERPAHRLTLCMIARDEADNLARCLDSVRGAVDQIVLVDTGSQDHTVQVARRYGAQVMYQPWKDDFSHARNRSLEAARGRWILVLDADEELSAASRPVIGSLLRRTDAEGFLVQIVNQLGENGATDQEVTLNLRLFRNRRAYRYSGAVHEQIAPAILARRPNARLIPAPVRVIHHGYTRAARVHKGKYERNVQILQRMMAESPHDPYLHYQLGLENLAAGRPQEAMVWLDRALATCPPEALWRPKLVKVRAVGLGELGHWPEVLSVLRDELEVYPDYTDLHYLAGMAALQLGQHDDAVKAFEQALHLGPAPSPPYASVDPAAGGSKAMCALGDSYRAAGRDEAALQAYIRAVPMEPGWIRPLEGITAVLSRWVAGSDLQRLLEALIPPHNDASRKLLADLLISAGRIAEAAEPASPPGAYEIEED